MSSAELLNRHRLEIDRVIAMARDYATDRRRKLDAITDPVLRRWAERA